MTHPRSCRITQGHHLDAQLLVSKLLKVMPSVGSHGVSVHRMMSAAAWPVIGNPGCRSVSISQ